MLSNHQRNKIVLFLHNRLVGSLPMWWVQSTMFPRLQPANNILGRISMPQRGPINPHYHQLAN